MPAEIRVHDQPQAGTEADGHTGAIWHGTRAEYQSSAPAAQGLPVLAQGVNVIRPNQVWSTDITYIRLPRGFVYLVAVIDWYSRKVLSWRLSNTLDSGSV